MKGKKEMNSNYTNTNQENKFLLKVPFFGEPTLTEITEQVEIGSQELQTLYFARVLSEAAIRMKKIPKWMTDNPAIDALIRQKQELIARADLLAITPYEVHEYWKEKLIPLTQEKISDITGFDKGEKFLTPIDVIEYFNKFGSIMTDLDELPIPLLTLQWMAVAVIVHKWHCEFNDDNETT